MNDAQYLEDLYVSEVIDISDLGEDKARRVADLVNRLQWDADTWNALKNEIERVGITVTYNTFREISDALEVAAQKRGGPVGHWLERLGLALAFDEFAQWYLEKIHDQD